MPKVTILLSVYNSVRYIKDAIDSILSQTFTDFEFLIYDDCSTDGTSEIIRSYTDSRIVHIRNDQNRGLVCNLIDGVNRARGEYIARMDGDDIAHLNRFEKQVAWLEAHPDYTILGSPVEYFNDANEDLGIAWQPTDCETIKAKLFISFTLLHPSIMMRRADLLKNGINYQEEYKSAEDHRMYMDCLAAGCKFSNYSEPLLRMRSHEGSVTKSKPVLTRKCADWSREALLSHFGILNEFNQNELRAWHDVASGLMPTVQDGVYVFDRFMNKIVAASSVQAHFDVATLQGCVANALKEIVYFSASKRECRYDVVAFFKTCLSKYATPWSLGMRLKFVLKLVLSFVK